MERALDAAGDHFICLEVDLASSEWAQQAKRVCRACHILGSCAWSGIGTLLLVSGTHGLEPHIGETERQSSTAPGTQGWVHGLSPPRTQVACE